MKTILLSCAIIFSMSACGPNIYKSNQFSDKTVGHKTVAILPSNVSISLRPNEMKNTSMANIRESEQKTGFMIQDKMYAWFLKRSNKKDFTVDFQDVTKTNAILAKNDITYENIKTKTMEELAKLLGVDAVIASRAMMKKPMSDGAAVALGLVLGTWGNTNDVQTSISIYESKQGDLLWKYDYNASGSIGSNTDNLVNNLMRNASKKFPYNSKNS